jgi:hypothetical protein
MPPNQTLEKIPILVTIFVREDTAQLVLEAIRRYKPTKLYVACDGPRADRPGETELVERAKACILDHVDWDCEVKALTRTENLGCCKAVSGAIDWFFTHEDRGIIIEDDCLPSDDFFKFCEVVIKAYENDSRIGSIAGFNPLGCGINSDEIFFSRYTRGWGCWATWRRAWKSFRNEAIDRDPDAVARLFHARYGWLEAHLAIKAFYKFYSLKERISWDHRWDAACMADSMLTVVPKANLLRNIGIGRADGTNTNSSIHSMLNVTYGQLQLPIRMPPFIHYDIEEDKAMKHWRLRTKARSFLSRVLPFVN